MSSISNLHRRRSSAVVPTATTTALGRTTAAATPDGCSGAPPEQEAAAATVAATAAGSRPVSAADLPSLQQGAEERAFTDGAHQPVPQGGQRGPLGGRLPGLPEDVQVGRRCLMCHTD